MKTVPNTDEDDSSKEWERIKNFVGARNKPSKHPLIQEAERQNMREPQHFDEGGDVQTVIPEIVADNTATPPIPNNSAIPTPTPSQTVGTSKAVSDAMGGVTPEMLQALQEKLDSGRGWNALSVGLGGVSDAIQSVGGIHENHMGNAQNMIQQRRENALKGAEMQMGAGKQKYELGKEIGNDDPASMRSFTAQEANKGFLNGLGFSPDEVRKIPASMIDGLRSGALERDKVREEIKSREAMQGMGFGLQKEQIEATKANQEASRKLQYAKDQQDAAKAVAGRTLPQRAADKIFGNPEVDILKKQAAGEAGGPQNGVYLHTATNSMGHKIGTKDGKTWEPIP